MSSTLVMHVTCTCVQVLDELGIEAIAGAVAAPKTQVAAAQSKAAGETDADLERMLQALKQ